MKERWALAVWSALVVAAVIVGGGEWRLGDCQEAGKAGKEEKSAEAKPETGTKAAAAEAKPAEPAKPAEESKPALPVKPEVEIANCRFVTSEFGAVVGPPVFQPGERITLRYEVSKFQTDVDGKSSLMVQHVLKSAADGKDMGTKEFEIKTVCAQGPPIIWAAHAVLPPGTGPGKYYFEIKVLDNLIGRKGSARADFEIGRAELAAVNVRFTADREGKTDVPPVFGLGQRAYLQFNVVGLKVDQDKVRCGVSAEAQGPDGLFRKIFKLQVPPAPAEVGCAPAVPVTILLNNSVAGKTQVNVEVHDMGGNTTITLPVTFEVIRNN